MIKGYFIQLKTDLVEFPQPNILFKLVIFLGIACILVLGARGTASQKTAIHQGFATISDDQFINSLGLNPCFVFFQSYLNEKENSAYIIPKNIDSYLFNVKKYLGVSNSDPLSINRNAVAVDPPTKKNLVIVLMESMCMYKLGYLKGNNISPNFSSIIKESIFFDRFYSSGTHTFAGLFATETGFPSIYTQHGLVNYTRKPFNSIGTILKENNFTNYFFTTHDPRFDNMEGFFKLNGYANIVGESEFSISESIGTLGVPDHVLLDKVIEKINSDKTEKPFHAFVLTSSDHGPWIVPDNISFKPNSENEQERAAQYADWAIGEFMKKAKKQSWYNNTIFVFLGDHGVYTATSYQMPLSFHHIPFVIHAANLKPDTNSNLGYQPDVLATVMGLLNINYENTGFGIDLLKEKHPYVFFNADVEYGIMNADGYYYFHMLPTDEKHIRNGLKFEERDYFDEKKAYADSMEFNARSIMESADFLIHKSYYNK